jgi:hypothetical protein
MAPRDPRPPLFAAVEPPADEVAEELGPVRITAEGVHHRGGFYEAVALAGGDVARLELVHASPVPRPLLVVLSGGLLAALGLGLAILLVPDAVEKELIGITCFWAGIGAVGVWLVVITLWKRFVLVAHTPDGPVRLVFPRWTGRREVVRFVVAAAARHGYPLRLGRGC